MLVGLVFLRCYFNNDHGIEMSEREGTTPTTVCLQCKKVIESTWVACPYCGARRINVNARTYNPSELQETEEYYGVDAPSSLWYLVPFFFGIIGGLIGYVGTKDRDEDMAKNLLIFGIIWGILLSLIAWAWVSSLMQ